MTTFRKLELVGGILVAVLSAYVGFTYIYLDLQTYRRLGESPVKGIIGLAIIDLLPGIAVLLGSILHALKRKQVGQFLLIIGTFVTVVLLVLTVLSPFPVHYGRLDLFWLSLLCAALAIVTSIVSVLVQKAGVIKQ